MRPPKTLPTSICRNGNTGSVRWQHSKQSSRDSRGEEEVCTSIFPGTCSQVGGIVLS